MLPADFPGKIYRNPKPRRVAKLPKHRYDLKEKSNLQGSHDGTQGDPLKWGLPGWRIEQAFSKKTLIGNWCEERNTFEHDNLKANSKNRLDLQAVEQVPETHLRRHALLKKDGNHAKYKTGNLYWNRDCSYISWFDSDYRREQNKSTRKWNRHRLCWEPEWSDHPVQGTPTQLGIRENKIKKWAEDKKLLSGSAKISQSTTYSGDYVESKDAFPLRYAQSPKHLRSSNYFQGPVPINSPTELHPPAQVKFDLRDEKDLRGQTSYSTSCSRAH